MSEEEPASTLAKRLLRKKSRIQNIMEEERRNSTERGNSSPRHNSASMRAGRTPSLRRRTSIMPGQRRPQLARLVSRMSRMTFASQDNVNGPSDLNSRRTRMGSIVAMSMANATGSKTWNNSVLKRQSTRFSLTIENPNVREGFEVSILSVCF